jgi:hypothetical protein
MCLRITRINSCGHHEVIYELCAIPYVDGDSAESGALFCVRLRSVREIDSLCYRCGGPPAVINAPHHLGNERSRQISAVANPEPTVLEVILVVVAVLGLSRLFIHLYTSFV